MQNCIPGEGPGEGRAERITKVESRATGNGLVLVFATPERTVKAWGS